MWISTRKCVDDDDDDSGGQTQRNCLTLAAPDRRPSQTEAKTNICMCEEETKGSGEEVFFNHCTGRAEETLDSESLGGQHSQTGENFLKEVRP